MTTKSEFSAVGLAHKVCLAAEAQGYTPELLNALAEHPTLFRDTLSVQLGQAEIRPIELSPPSLPILFLTEGVTVEVPAIARFVAAEAFVESTADDAVVKIAYLGNNFKQLLLVETEENVPAVELAVHALIRNAPHAEIMNELGNRKAISLSQFYQVLKAQGHGQAGPLRTDGWANIAHIIDMDNFWAVNAGWHSGRGGWFVDARLVGFLDRLGQGLLVVSRKSC